MKTHYPNLHSLWMWPKVIQSADFV